MTDPGVATFAGPKVTGVDQECATVEKLGVQELALADSCVLLIGGWVNVTDLVVATLSGPKVMGWLQECVLVELLVKSENAFVDGC